jgi:uncharacterized protein (DUF488 family)
VASLGAIYTVGHSTRPVEELIALLREAGVELLVDVRRFPGSRRHPQFGAEPLAAALAAAGVDYRHEPRLGGRRRPLAGSPNDAWRNEQFRGYADHMASEEFASALRTLTVEAHRRPTAVMCAEALPARCHRNLLADALDVGGWEVVHLLAPGRVERHRRHPQLAVGPGGRFTYPAAAAAQPLLPGLEGSSR